jgi:hypothetical protein
MFLQFLFVEEWKWIGNAHETVISKTESKRQLENLGVKKVRG